MIALREFPEWSGRKIAEVCGVGHQLAQHVRKEKQLDESSSSSEPPKRIGIDGKARSMPSKPRLDGWIAPGKKD